MLNEREKKFLDNLIQRYPVIIYVQQEVEEAYTLMKNAYENGGKLLIAGNGGSAADSEHIAGELMKSFKLLRPISPVMTERLGEIEPVRGRILAEKLANPLPAISLVTHEALLTAYINDVDGDGVFAQQVLGLGKSEDVFLAISTSGNSENIINAAIVAKALEMKVVGLTGAGAGELTAFCDVVIGVPEEEIYKIQELHLPIYHCWCMMLEDFFFRN